MLSDFVPGSEPVASNDSVAINVLIAFKRRGRRWIVQPIGEAASMRDIARREGTNLSCIARHINLTLLAPEIVVAILDEAVPEGVQLLMLAINPTLQLGEEREQLTTRSTRVISSGSG